MTLKARITAIDRFIKGLKEDNIYADLQAACVMAGWDSLAGALTPLVGAAPSNSGFIATDYDRGGIGIEGDETSYINSNRADNDELQNDKHLAVYATAASSTGFAIAGALGAGGSNGSQLAYGATDLVVRANQASSTATGVVPLQGLHGVSRASSSAINWRSGGFTDSNSVASTASEAIDIYVFGRNYATTAVTDATLAFYSIGSATDLALLDARVSTLMADLRAIEEVGFDSSAIEYIRNVEEADGAFLETDVKVAINNLVSGLKADGLWDAIGSSCLLCGPRTLAGALVPLRGDAPTAYGFVDGDYDREGLTGDGSSYLDSNRANDADPQNDHHLAAYCSSGTLSAGEYIIGTTDTATPTFSVAGYRTYSRSSGAEGALGGGVGLYAVSRSSGAGFSYTQASGSVTFVGKGSAAVSISQNSLVFAYADGSGSADGVSDNTLSFYSIGTSLDLALLDSHVSNYVTAIGASV
jgi:hypothetical protein